MPTENTPHITSSLQDSSNESASPVVAHPQTHKNHCFLHPSASETSLQRTRSLILPPKTKHSPDCKDNPDKF